MPSLVQAGIITLATYILAMTLIFAIGPVIDQIDDIRESAVVDFHTFDGADATLANLHDWFYGIIIVGCALTTIWFFMVVIAKVQLKRQEDRMYQTNYPRW